MDVLNGARPDANGRLRNHISGGDREGVMLQRCACKRAEPTFGSRIALTLHENTERAAGS